MPHGARSRRTRVIGAVLLAFALVACGGSDSSSSGSSGSGSGGGGGDDGPVTIGAMVFETGRFADFGSGAKRGMEAAVAYVNENGGVLGGRDLEVEFLDTQSDQAQALTAVNRFAGDDSIVGVVGPSGTPDLLGVMPIAEDLGLPIVSYASAQVLPKEDFPPNLFRVSLVQTPEVLTAFLEEAKERNGLEKIAVIYDHSNPQPDEEGKSVTSLAPELDLEVTASESFASTDTAFTTQVDRALAGSPDAIWISATAPANAQIMRQARDRGFEGRFLGGATLQVPEVAEIAADAAVGLHTFQAFDLASDDELVVDFVSRHESMFPGENIGSYTVYGFDSILVLADAIDRAGSADRAAITEALGTTSGMVTLQGPYSFDGSGDNTSVATFYSELKEDFSFEVLD